LIARRGLFLQADSAARGLVIGTVAVSVIAESRATDLGQTESGASLSGRRFASVVIAAR
jgi:hypothetical protein